MVFSKRYPSENDAWSTCNYHPDEKVIFISISGPVVRSPFSLNGGLIKSQSRKQAYYYIH